MEKVEIKATMTPIERIHKKLQTLRLEGWEKYAKFFGVDHHRLQLNPCLSSQEIARFEEQHQITLPDDYRQFLLHIGNGGAGPYYGIAALHQWDECAAHLSDTPIAADFLSALPLLTPEYHQQKERWQSVHPVHPQDAYRGCMMLCEQGCTYFTLLIVSGEHAGRVVYVDIDHLQPPYFVAHTSFLMWYEAWVDELLTQTERSRWFGMNND
jgi:hypothetical protein